MPCTHCHQRPATHAGLCWTCKRSIGARLEPREPLPERGEDKGTHRCLWCLRWRCFAWLKRCQVCQAEYERRAVGMSAGR